LEGNSGSNILTGGAGIDTLSYANSSSGVHLSLAIASAQITIGAGTDTASGFENLTGSTFGDLLTGSSTANTIAGLNGDDTLIGGAGADTLIGGLGSDHFVYTAVTDSGPGASDQILDFVNGTDIIDVSAIDANSSSKAKGDQAFVFGGQSATAKANSVTWFESGGNTVVQADVNGDTTPELAITLTGVNLHLAAADFVL
jgi:Ca2+-binding RTX toxin-like protein